MGEGGGLRANQTFGFSAERDFVREVQGVGPVNDLTVRIVGVFGAERGPTDQAFEHNGPHGPPVAAEGIASAAKDLRCDVIWSAHRGICHNAARLAPGVDLNPIADGQVDLVKRDRVPVARLAGRPLQQLLVVGVLMLGMEPG